jgi:Flp pilus assembly protein TadG
MITKKKQQGGEVVEFALLAPLLFVILFGIIEFAVALYNQAVITNASREGARLGILWTNELLAPAEVKSNMEEAVTAAAGAYLVSLSGSPTVRPNCVPGIVSGDDVTCQVNYTYNFLVLRPLVALLGGAIPGSVDLSSTTIMRME